MTTQLLPERARTLLKESLDGRELTPDELAHVQKAVEWHKAGGDFREQMSRFDPGAPDASAPGGGTTKFGRPGDVFVQSAGYKSIADPASRPQHWTTGAVEVSTKATLLEGTGASPGTGGALVEVDTRTGVIPTLFQPPTIADLLGQATTNSNTVRVVEETVATNAAATVAEAGTKPESTLEFDETDEPVRKIATVLPLSEELLEDRGGLQSYLNGRLSMFVQLEEDDQLLNGNGTGTNINGLLKRVPAANLDIASTAASPNLADHIYAAMSHVRTTSFLEPDTVVINPDDWEVIRLLKDSQQNYIAGPPFSTSPQPGESLWGKRVVVTQAIQGQVLVGAFRLGATLYRRGGLRVEATNAHSTFFVENKVMVRAETRLALGVHRSEAFSTVDIAS